MVMPKMLNPGPWVSQITFFAPVSLFFFFFLMLIFSTVKEIRVHPMNYFFVGAAFFSFHLLLAYLVDHISIHLAFMICSVVSIFLVITYMRLVVGAKFAMLHVGISQFVYLVGFSYTFFFEGATGLTVTIMCIATLFGVMQYTGRLDWEKVFRDASDRLTQRTTA
jgi:inner membrane protein involved in colicin E2 resistance